MGRCLDGIYFTLKNVLISWQVCASTVYTAKIKNLWCTHNHRPFLPVYSLQSIFSQKVRGPDAQCKSRFRKVILNIYIKMCYILNVDYLIEKFTQLFDDMFPNQYTFCRLAQDGVARDQCSGLIKINTATRAWPGTKYFAPCWAWQKESIFRAETGRA